MTTTTTEADAFAEALAVFMGTAPAPDGQGAATPAYDDVVELFDPPRVAFWKPYPKQAMAAELTTRCFELLFGGSAGPGKSMFLRGFACDYAYRYPKAHIGIVRRTLPSLKKTHGLHLPAMVGDHAKENLNEGTFTFKNGSVVRFISLTHPGDEQKYKSEEYDVLLFDELTEFVETQYTFMLSRVRSAQGNPTCVVATSNPEGVGFRWVKRRFVSPRPEDLAEGQFADTDGKPVPGVPWAPPVITDGQVTGWAPLRAFLPATLRDNPGLLASNPGYVQQLESLPDTRLRRALVDGDWDAMDTIPGALWNQTCLDGYRVATHPDLIRVVVGIDPSGSSNKGDRECGIVVAGLDAAGHVYILADASGSMTPDQWASKAAEMYRRHRADRVIAERNFGGDMVLATLENAEPLLPVELVTASRGKAVRAEPVAALTTRGRIHLVGRLPELEDQLTTWLPDSGWSPDRLDAMVWAVTELLGGSAAMAFLSQASALCPECKMPNTTGRPTCTSCGADLPHALPTGPATLPAGERVPVLGLPAPNTDGPTAGAFAFGGLLLPNDPTA